MMGTKTREDREEKITDLWLNNIERILQRENEKKWLLYGMSYKPRTKKFVPVTPPELKMFWEFCKDEKREYELTGTPMSKMTFVEFYKDILKKAYRNGSISREFRKKRRSYLYRFCNRGHLNDKASEWEAKHHDLRLGYYRRYHKRHRRKRAKYNHLYHVVNREEILKRHKRNRQRKENIRLKKEAKHFYTGVSVIE